MSDNHISGVYWDPLGCYFEGNSLKIHSYQMNSGSCSSSDKCLCKKPVAWSACTKTCGGGSQKRTRTNTAPRNGGAVCPHTAETQACKTASCPVDCQVGDWFSNTYELKTSGYCTDGGGDYIHDSATCEKAAAFLGLSDTSASNDGQYNGVSYDPLGCYFEWSNLKIHTTKKNSGSCSSSDKCLCKKPVANTWSACTKTCGGGSQKRTRTNTAPRYGGTVCPHTAETQACNQSPCAVHCATSAFSSWSTCSTSCGTGSQSRSRTQTEPTNGGVACPHYDETRACNEHACAVHCATSAFSSWSTCTKSCGTGSQSRRPLPTAATCVRTSRRRVTATSTRAPCTAPPARSRAGAPAPSRAAPARSRAAAPSPTLRP